VSTRASNIIVVISFRMMGLPSWVPLTIMVTGSPITRCGKPHVLFRCSKRRSAWRFPVARWPQSGAVSPSAPRATVNPAVKARILELRANANGMLKIGKKLGIGTSVVQRVFKQERWQA
jgi:hypothetical protein